MKLHEDVHPDMQILLDARESVGENNSAGKSVDAYRSFWEKYYRAIPNPRPESIIVEDLEVSLQQHKVPVRVYRPAAVTDNAPCIIYLHGGGFMLGDLESSDIIAWGFSAETDAVTVSVAYRLAPEHPYPAALMDSYGVLCWVQEVASQLGINPDRIALVGDSAGGCLATATCRMSRDQGGPRVRAQAMIYPVTGVAMDSPSYRENADAAGLTANSMKFFLENYLQRPSDWADSLARPVLTELGDLSGLPPAFVHTAQFDPIRDDGRVYAAMLARAGCNVTYREVPGMIHGFYRLRLASPAVADEFNLLCDFLSQTLSR